MPGSEPPETNDNPAEGANTNKIAACIRVEFQMLIAMLVQQIELQEDPDSEIMARLWDAKVAAERGLRLSERLMKTTQGKEGR